MAKQKITKDKVVSRLVKWGNNKKDSIKMVDEHFDFVMRCYDGSTINQVANIVRDIF